MRTYKVSHMEVFPQRWIGNFRWQTGHFIIHPFLVYNLHFLESEMTCLDFFFIDGYPLRKELCAKRFTVVCVLWMRQLRTEKPPTVFPLLLKFLFATTFHNSSCFWFTIYISEYSRSSRSESWNQKWLAWIFFDKNPLLKELCAKQFTVIWGSCLLQLICYDPKTRISRKNETENFCSCFPCRHASYTSRLIFRKCEEIAVWIPVGQRRKGVCMGNITESTVTQRSQRKIYLYDKISKVSFCAESRENNFSQCAEKPRKRRE